MLSVNCKRKTFWFYLDRLVAVVIQIVNEFLFEVLQGPELFILINSLLSNRKVFCHYQYPKYLY